jgi:hypothetical protein
VTSGVKHGARSGWLLLHQHHLQPNGMNVMNSSTRLGVCWATKRIATRGLALIDPIGDVPIVLRRSERSVDGFEERLVLLIQYKSIVSGEWGIDILCTTDSSRLLRILCSMLLPASGGGVPLC